MAKQTTEMKSEAQLNAEAKEVAFPYGKVTFGIPGKRTVSDRWGRVSVKMLDASVPVNGTGLRLVCAIYANIERKGNAISVIPSAYIPGKVVQPEIEGAAELLIAHIENSAATWEGYDAAYDATAAALMGKVEPNAVEGLKLATVARPMLARLVKNGETVATAAIPATA